MLDDTERFYQDIFVDKTYDFGIPSEENMVVVDIGANVGLFTQYIHARSKVIYAIEPDNDNYKSILTRIYEKSLFKTIPFNHAISKQTGMVTLYGNGSNGGYSTHFPTEKSVQVLGYSLSDFIKSNHIEHIDLLKIDCEGGEDEIINDPSFDAIAPLISHIVGEVHAALNVQSKLISLGFSYKQIGMIFSCERIK